VHICKVCINTNMHIRNWTQEQLDYLNRYYTSKPRKEIEAFLGKKWHAIINFASKRGLFRPQSQFNKRNGSLRPLLEDTYDALYWMGFLFADGYCCEYLSQIVVALAIEDKDHLEKFAEFLKSKTSKQYNIKGGFTLNSSHYRVSVAEKGVCEQIIQKWDWKKNKTYNPPGIDTLTNLLDTEDKFISFLVGFIDGDGCISKNGGYAKVENHPSWAPFHQKCIDFLHFYGYSVNMKVNYSKRGYASFSILSQGIRKIKQKILSINIPHLERKWIHVQ